ncbi:TRAP transporter small permease subunit [Desulfocurvus sp. DL9XJH121]
MHSENTALGPGPSQAVDTLVRRLDWISDLFGKGAAFFIIPMMYALVHEVIARYFFNAPTIWAGDTALILYGIYFMVASPYCLKEGGHIRTDFLYAHWSVRTKGLMDMIIYVLLYFPAHIVFLWVGWNYFMKSFHQNETIISSPWMPIIWPMKFAIPLGLFLMILQGLSETIKSYYAFRYNKWFWEKAEHSPEDHVPECLDATQE